MHTKPSPTLQGKQQRRNPSDFYLHGDCHPSQFGRPRVTLAEVEEAHDPAGTFVAGTMLPVVIVTFDNLRVGFSTHATGGDHAVVSAWGFSKG